jgi:hypothetical protein
MNYKKIALFFLVFFSFNQILPMENEIVRWWSEMIKISFIEMIASSFFGLAIGIGLTYFYETIIKKIIKNFFKQF